MPFYKGGSRDERHVVKVDNLLGINVSVMRQNMMGASLSGEARTLAGRVSAKWTLCTVEFPYTPVLGYWDSERVGRECDSTPERRHGSPKACMMEEEKPSVICRTAGVLVVLRVRQGSCDRVPQKGCSGTVRARRETRFPAASECRPRITPQYIYHIYTQYHGSRCGRHRRLRSFNF